MSRIRALVATLLIGSAIPADAATLVVTNTNTSGAGSLSKAITDANLTTDPDVINFAITGGPLVKTIGGTLPAITQPLTIDGYTQTGSAKNTVPSGSTNALIRIELDASGIGVGGIMIAVTNESTTLEGIAIKNLPVKATGIDASGESSVSVRGCFIGTDASGLVGSSSGTGIVVRSIASIGGVFADRSLVSGHAGAGILMRGVAMSMLNTLVGTNAAGAAVLGNGTGLLFSSSELPSSIGGSSAEQQSVFAGNDGAGIRIGVASAGSVSIGANSFFDNGGLAVDLLGDGVTENDEGDLDDGPNGLQNFPVLTFARANAATLTVEGYLESQPGTYRISFYRSTAVDPSGFGEGQKFVQTIEVEIPDGETSVAFREKLAVGFGLSSTPFVSAMAENVADGASSEFSETLDVIQGGQELVVTNTADAGVGSLRQTIVDANANPDSNTIVFDLAIDEPRVITPTLSFKITEPLVIDGYSQPGASVNTLAEGSNARPRVVIDGSALSAISKSALTLSSHAVVVRGLVVQGSTNTGIAVQDTGDSSEGIRIEGCFVGTDETGMQKVANTRNGIVISGFAGVVVGGPHPSQRNIVSGNGASGIVDASAGAVILNNIVGGDATGAGSLGNTERGVDAVGDHSTVGSEVAAAGNVISGNGSAGVLVNNGSDNRILINRIVGNGGLGIDLVAAESDTLGINANDIDDVDAGPNDGQNFPEILGTSSLPGSLKIDGRLDVPAATVGATYTLHFYANTFCDSSGNGEGQFFLGQADVVLSDNDDEFLVNLPVDFDGSLALTATATDVALGNTSEFSACFGGLPALDVCGDASDDGNISAPDALLTLKAAVGTGQCEACRCDVNSLNGVTAADALLLLRLAVGQQVALLCPPCV